MVPALLTTVLFAISAVSANRSTRLLGGLQANFWRITLATLLLAAWAHSAGSGLSGKAFPWFLLSGCVGFGLGDLALYQALPRLGSRLAILLVHCLAAPFAALVEWLWLGTTLTGVQILSSLTILGGVGIALAPDRRLPVLRRVLITGVVFGVIAAIGQGYGAVLSRKAYQIAASAGESIDGLTAAYQRILAGWAVAALSMAIARPNAIYGSGTAPPGIAQRWRTSWHWVLVNALAGPTLGVGCFQWALATSPTGVVLPIVAITPIVVIPFALLVEGERPRVRSLLGGAVAVLGTVALAGGAKLLPFLD
ncbi:MAG: EamA family transporter [Verrucomicrobiia bacterium]